MTWLEEEINGMDHYLTIEFLVGGYDYVRDDMWIGRS
jgi:hypothetical protein